MKRSTHSASLLSLAATLALAVAVHAAAPTSWQWRGLGAGGGMFSPAISPHDPNVMFLAIDMSELVRTLDGGASWTTVDFAQLQTKQFTEVQFTATPGVLYAAEARRLADESAIARPLKSTNNGATWTPFNNWPPAAGQQATGAFSSPNRDDTLLVCTGSRLWFYQNSGTGGTFSNAWTFSGSQGRVGGVFWRGSEVWAGTSEGLLYSTNGGASFSAAVPQPASTRIISFAAGHDTTNGTLRFHAVTTLVNVNAQATPHSFSGGQSNRVWRLDWSAPSPAWVDVTGNIPAADHVTIVGMARNNADYVFAAANRTGSYPDNCAVWRLSTPGGAWQSIFLTPGNSNLITGWGSLNSRATSGNRQLETKITYAAPGGLAVHPSQPDRVLVCDNAVIHLVTNATSASPLWRQIYCAADNPGHGPGQLIPAGQSYASLGLEITAWNDVVWASPSNLLAACLDISAPVSTDGGRRWGYPFDHTTLGVADVNAVAYDPVANRYYAACAGTFTVYDFLGSDDAHTDVSAGASSLPPGLYYQTPGDPNWTALKTDFGVAAGQAGASPVSLTLDSPGRRLFVSIVSSNATKDGIYVGDLANGTWSKLPAPTRLDVSNNLVTVQHPYNVCVLSNGAIVATYSAHQVGDATQSSGSNGAYRATSGVFHLAPGASTWTDRTDPQMRYFTRDLLVDPSDPTQQTWFAAVWNTDLTSTFPSDATANPRTYGGLYRTTNAGTSWTRIFAGDATFSGSVTSATLHPDPALKDELYLTTRFGGLWVTTNCHAANPVFTRVASYPFRAPQRVRFNPYNADEMWVLSNGNGAVVGTRPTTFAEWQLRRFGAQAGNSLVAGASADPDGDGWVNFQEYVLGTSPLAADPPPPRPSQAALGAALDLAFSRAPAASDVTWLVEGSADLSVWQTLAQASGQNAWTVLSGLLSETNGLVSFTDSALPSSAVARFLRVRASSP